VPQIFPVVLPADIEMVGQAFLTPILYPTPVKTRRPIPVNTEDTLHGFMRIEAGDSVPVNYGAAYDISWLMHAYSDNEDEASLISRTAIANVAAATGKTVAGWYIVDVPTVMGGQRLNDPLVPSPGLLRYRSAVTWRIAGHPL
jgi:hypothetical protein